MLIKLFDPSFVALAYSEDDRSLARGLMRIADRRPQGFLAVNNNAVLYICIGDIALHFLTDILHFFGICILCGKDETEYPVLGSFNNLSAAVIGFVSRRTGNEDDPG